MSVNITAPDLLRARRAGGYASSRRPGSRRACWSLTRPASMRPPPKTAAVAESVLRELSDSSISIALDGIERLVAADSKVAGRAAR